MNLTYAIGDVHGRRDLLAALLAAIRRDAAHGARVANASSRQPAADNDVRIIFLGDLIDRGPESRQCLDLVIKTLAEFPNSRLILGNHEEFMLDFLDSRSDRATAARRWLPNGGAATLRSYGHGDTARIDAIAAALARDYPSHVIALRQADWMVQDDRYAYVHAGIDPALSLKHQDPRTTRWIREQFLDHRAALPRTVIHGHTITASALPELHPGRIAIDTGAVHSGHLTCAVLADGAPPRFLATDDHGPSITVEEIRPLDCR